MNKPVSVLEEFTVDIEPAAERLKRGGIIACPTEGVYGLSCDPQNELAVQRLLQLKQRSPAKGLILAAATIEQIEPYLKINDANVYQHLTTSWPGPTTWLVPCKASTPRWLRGEHHTIAVRVTAHPTLNELCQLFGGALVSTSANLGGQPAAQTIEQMASLFNSSLLEPQRDGIIVGKLGTLNKPTEIRDASSGELVRR